MVRRTKIWATPPGPKAKELIERDESMLSPSLTRTAPLVAADAEGVWVKDVDGNEYLDFGSGIAVTNVGHKHHRVVQAVKEQVDKLIFANSCDFYTLPQVDLAERLLEITPGDFSKRVFFGNSGTEAVECSLKAAKYKTRGYYFIGFINAFHGRTLGSLAFTTTSVKAREGFQPMMPGVVHVPYAYCFRCPYKLTYPDCGAWCVDFIEEIVLDKVAPPGEVAAMMFEPIQGPGGYIVPPEEFVKGLLELSEKHGIPLIDDEIQSGMGRTGKWWAIEHFGVVPDMICISKALAAGFPMGACVARAELMDWQPGAHENTLGGNPVLCNVALAVIDVIEREELLKNAEEVGAHVMSRLQELMERHEIIGDVRGKGLMIGVELVKDRRTKDYAVRERKRIMEEAFKKGLILLGASKSTIRLAPPLILTKEEADLGLEILEEAIKMAE